jgi:transcriptional regulator with XRE-family HTH domain
MASSLGDTPAVARERVRRALRRARQATELTQSDVAQSLGWSLSKVQRIEIGDVTVSETDLRAMLVLYGAVTPELMSALADDARLARRERYSTPQEYRQHLPQGLRKLLQFEARAAAIRSYQPLLLPGVLQTPAMAEYIVKEAGSSLTEEQRQVRFDVRTLRRKQVIERLDGPKFFLVVDESVLERLVGGPRIMAEQLEDLAEVATRPNVHIRAVPKEESRGAIVGMIGAFVLMTLSDDDSNDSVLYQERYPKDNIENDPDRIQPYRDAFEQLWDLSLSVEATLRLIGTLATRRRSELDRQPDQHWLN